MRGLAVQALTTTVAAAVLTVGAPAVPALADPVLVYPGMEIHQDVHVCTLGYVDPVLRVAFTAGHCRGSGPVTNAVGDVIGAMATFRDNTPNGTTVNTDQVIADYEAIALSADVVTNDVLPGGLRLQATPNVTVEPGEPVCHFGIVTGETCGTVDRVNNGWFTMSNGVRSQQGDSGGPVYVVRGPGSAQVVGLFNSVWGDYPAAVSWSALSAQVREDVGVPAPRP
ncbi:Rv1815 family serine proteinase [Mycolicibacter acidiphilus]|uniref:Rv1815 family serine proteinase n=1 Tax=Mycolicibacter acidiphilus TaxID=2835306 RepID=UPI0035591C93